MLQQPDRPGDVFEDVNDRDDVEFSIFNRRMGEPALQQRDAIDSPRASHERQTGLYHDGIEPEAACLTDERASARTGVQERRGMRAQAHHPSQ